MFRVKPSLLKNCQITMTTTLRSISIGTDMHSSVTLLERAHPWHMTNIHSNLTVDNTVRGIDLFPLNQTVVMFGVPAPFTGTCTQEHYPGYAHVAKEIYETTSCSKILCYAVTDPYTMDGWIQSMTQQQHSNDAAIQGIVDPNALFAKAYGIDHLYDAYSLGVRSKRFSMIIVNGIVQYFKIVTDAKMDATEVLEELRNLDENKDLLVSHS